MANTLLSEPVFEGVGRELRSAAYDLDFVLCLTLRVGDDFAEVGDLSECVS